MIKQRKQRANTANHQPHHRKDNPGQLNAAVVALLLMALFVAVVAGAFFAVSKFDAAFRTGRCSASGLDTSHSYNTDQTYNAALISAIAVDRGLPPRAASIALATAFQESRLENIDYGDRDSIGLFQQRPSQGWGTVAEIMDPVYAANKFYEALEAVSGYENMEITVAAQTVQRSAYPDAYADHEVEGRLFASALTGYSAGELQCDLAAPGGPGNPLNLQQKLSEHYTRLVAAGTISSSLGDAGDSLISNAGAATLEITVKAESLELGWSIANWAVANAASEQIVAVDFQGQRWDRSRKVGDGSLQWQNDATGGAGGDEAKVVVYFASSPAN